MPIQLLFQWTFRCCNFEGKMSEEHWNSFLFFFLSRDAGKFYVLCTDEAWQKGTQAYLFFKLILTQTQGNTTPDSNRSCFSETWLSTEKKTEVIQKATFLRHLLHSSTGVHRQLPAHSRRADPPGHRKRLCRARGGWEIPCTGEHGE